MKPQIRYSFAAILAVGTLGIAQAQGDQPTDKPVNYVKEPVASLPAAANGPDAALANDIVAALNQEPTLQSGAKIVVQSDNGVIYLTGAVTSEDQAKRARALVAEKAGDAKVVSVLQADRQTTFRSWDRLG
jgi:osmotically-inducible protein OsmY